MPKKKTEVESAELEVKRGRARTPPAEGAGAKGKRGRGAAKASGPAYPALKFGDEERHNFYQTSIPVDDLAQWCFSQDRKGHPAQGYQRGLDEKRAEEIAKYIDEGGIIPGNIVVSAQPAASLTYDRANKTIRFNRSPRAFAVIDGQHRLWGHEKAQTRLRMSVAVMVGLTRADEARLFMDINTKQKGVGQALLLDIKALAERENEREAALRELYDRLGSDPKSPLHGKVSPTGEEPGKLSRVSFNRAFGPVGGLDALGDAAPADARYRMVRDYLSALAAEAPGTDMLLRPLFLAAAASAMPQVLENLSNRYAHGWKPYIRDNVKPLVAVWGLPDVTRLGKSDLMLKMMQSYRRGNGLRLAVPEDDDEGTAARSG